MPSTTEIAKLFGFIAKETAVGEHIANAAMGAAAKGVYNVATGRDLTDGVIGAGVVGAGIGVGLKTYQNIEKAGLVAGAMDRSAGAASAITKMRQEAKGLRGAAKAGKGAERKALAGKLRAARGEATAARGEYSGWVGDMKLRPTTAAKAPTAKAPSNAPVQPSAAVGTGTTMAADAGGLQQKAAKMAPVAGQHAVNSNQPVQKQGLFRRMWDSRKTKIPESQKISMAYDRGGIGAMSREARLSPKPTPVAQVSAGPVTKAKRSRRGWNKTR